ncbi:hypothetical protein HSX10_17540 [Winogradskyella undariae]|uniref:hypothetical protein n=1 Tax=Winogradskyella undariae TaxID=1285465 RepID=UPI00156BD29F|nr:hypothetical protein [Winogradskyella undariae]NRR93381.1 hypothetical protein [Winogradskyella undariae]
MRKTSSDNRIMDLKTQKAELKSINWDGIKNELNKLDGIGNGYLTLENDNGDYIQCAGNPSMLTVEFRLNSKPNFKHYVLGKGKDKSPMKVSWIALQNNVGPIMVHKEEVLNIKDAEWIFKEFFENQTIPTELNKRNVTKLHLEK